MFRISSKLVAAALLYQKNEIVVKYSNKASRNIDVDKVDLIVYVLEQFLTAGLEEIRILLRDRTEKNVIVKP
ncbi:hypothetical protein EVAR_86213_1 [Eumeta japonica]|uniref:Uncharacterized protein n=1 Tax=Eumeta variegata TaxID=151549 RepID=A0A4C1UCI5_EUMVA|nr:hypothetical protein EVAR_86213_1 [Eumeta japonica]